MTAVLERIPGAEALGSMSKRNRSLTVAAGVVLAYFGLYNLPLTADFIQDKAPYSVLFIGTVQGTTTALLAMGLILIYRTNRFVNFSYAAMGALPGAFALGLHLEHGFPFFAALVLAVVIGVAVGFVTELVIRRFKNSSRLIVTVASIGLAQIFGVMSLLANKAIGFISLAGGFTIPLDLRISLEGGIKTMTGDEILIIAVVPAVIAGLAWFLLRTDAGVAIRAAAENEDRALLLGIPVYKLGRIVWMIAGALAALTYVLQAPSAGVSPSVVSAGPAVLLPALAAAVAVVVVEELGRVLEAGEQRHGLLALAVALDPERKKRNDMEERNMRIWTPAMIMHMTRSLTGMFMALPSAKQRSQQVKAHVALEHLRKGPACRSSAEQYASMSLDACMCCVRAEPDAEIRRAAEGLRHAEQRRAA